MALIRTIQYYGLLRIPNALKNVKNYQIYFDLLRRPKQPFTNIKYPFPKGFYGYLQLNYKGRVVDTYALEYEKQVVCRDKDDSIYLHASISCHLEAMLTSFINVANYLEPGYVVQRNNPIKDWTNFKSPIFDEIAIRMLDEFCIANITFDWESVDVCTVPFSEPPEDGKDSIPPPSPDVEDFDAPNSAFPPVSPAYDGIDDDGRTYNPDPPVDPGNDTVPCTAYSVIFQFERVSKLPGQPEVTDPGLPITASLFGRIGAISSRVIGQTGQILISSQGYSFAECQPSPLDLIVWEETILFQYEYFRYENVRIIEIV
jgi:hypothetical protein